MVKLNMHCSELNLQQSTKEKILAQAEVLFAQKGPDAASMRDIAKAAKVNLAAINYHFINKENLLKASVVRSIENTKKEIEYIYNRQTDWSVEDFTRAILDWFMQHGDHMRLSMKLFLSSPGCPALDFKEGSYLGPPGGEYFYRVFKQNAPKASHDDLMWASKILMTEIIHKSMIMGGTWQEDMASVCSLEPLAMQNDLLRLTMLLFKEVRGALE